MSVPEGVASGFRLTGFSKDSSSVSVGTDDGGSPC